MQRFPIRFTGLNHTMALVGMVPSRCSVDLTDDRIHVQMGMWFDLEAPLATVARAEPNTDRVYGWGVHGWRDRWLVNGSSQGLVRITFAPTQRAWMGPVPLRVRVLRVSVDDPDGLVAALAPGQCAASEIRQVFLESVGISSAICATRRTWALVPRWDPVVEVPSLARCK